MNPGLEEVKKKKKGNPKQTKTGMRVKTSGSSSFHRDSYGQISELLLHGHGQPTRHTHTPEHPTLHRTTTTQPLRSPDGARSYQPHMPVGARRTPKWQTVCYLIKTREGRVAREKMPGYER
ncbi:hypothetical protein EVAR_32720_1 [Eumeta japonica]|uniref:Uncharacterized protein n=1 Tax=Eumeta variegata TaxID=151549 RepID=A0A4C1Z7L0_EUMVA|nr:hypothetical protein EVAR_32720_1 [Eumeta japonica]